LFEVTFHEHNAANTYQDADTVNYDQSKNDGICDEHWQGSLADAQHRCDNDPACGSIRTDASCSGSSWTTCKRTAKYMTDRYRGRRRTPVNACTKTKVNGNLAYLKIKKMAVMGGECASGNAVFGGGSQANSCTKFDYHEGGCSGNPVKYGWGGDLQIPCGVSGQGVHATSEGCSEDPVHAERTSGFCSDIDCATIGSEEECTTYSAQLGLPAVAGTHNGHRLPGCFLYIPSNNVEFNTNLHDTADWHDTDSICKCGNGWNVVSPDTTLTGSKVNSGTPLPVTVKLHLGSNEWILGLIDGQYLKMVKIKITGSTTYDWRQTKYDSSYAQCCTSAQSFSEMCFKGTDAGSDMYPVSLRAIN